MAVYNFGNGVLSAAGVDAPAVSPAIVHPERKPVVSSPACSI